MGLIIGGKKIVIPGVVPEIEASEMAPIVLGSARLPLVLGVSEGGIPGKVYVFRSIDEAREVIRAGTVLSYIARMFRPSPLLPGATRVLFIRVNPAAQASLPLSATKPYSITLSPVSQEINLDAGVVTFVVNGTIERFNGFDEDVRLFIPGSVSDGAHFSGQFADADRTTTFDVLDANGHVTIAPVNPEFTVEVSVDSVGWAAHGSLWTNFQFTGTSSETGVEVRSNVATVVEAPPPKFSIVVTPAASAVTFSGGAQVDPPLVLTVNIIRENDFAEPVDVLVPVMEGSWDGWQAVINGVQLPVEAEFGPWLVENAPDTFTCEYSGTAGGWSLVNWETAAGGVRFIGSSASFPTVHSNLVTVDKTVGA